MKKAVCILLALLAASLSFLTFASCSGELQPEVLTSDPATVAELISGSEKLTGPVDYSDMTNWLSFEDSGKKVDVIYFYPEIYFAKEGENEICSIDNPEMREKAPAYLESQAAVFAESCNVYAPFYRQIDRSFLLSQKDDKTRDLIYQYAASKDAASALDYFFEHVSGGRPFILAGHDQGSDIIRWILADYMEAHPEIYKRMVAAYAIGCTVTQPFLNQHKHLKFAEKATDTGVIISYNTEGQDNYNFNSGILVKCPQTLAINPISWRTDKVYSSPMQNLGMLTETGEIVPGIADARVNVERASVMCDNDKELEKYAITGEETKLYGPQSYHYMDYAFFFMNLRENVKTRIDAFFSK